MSGRGKSYCSKICCMYNAKHAMYIREKYPDVDVTVFYIDVRTPGKGFDEFQRRAVEEYGVHYVRGQVGKVVVDGDGKLTVFASDLNSGRKLMLNPDLVVLATAVQPSPCLLYTSTVQSPHDRSCSCRAAAAYRYFAWLHITLENYPLLSYTCCSLPSTALLASGSFCLKLT